MNGLNKLDQFLVDSVEDKESGCRVIVDYSMEPNTMRVPPDVFSRIKQFSDEAAFDEIRSGR